MPYRTELKRPDLKGTFRCSLCYKIFCHSSSLSRHRMQAHFKSYTCTLCNKEITSNETLRAHMYKQHQISRMFMCRCCNWAFPDKTSLHIHMQAMASGNPGNVSIIAKSSASPNPPARPAHNGDSPGKPDIPPSPHFPGFPPPAGLFPGGIFPSIPRDSDLIQRLRERAMMNGAAHVGMNHLAAWFTSTFPQVDASGVGNLGGTLNPYQEEEANEEMDTKDTADESEDGKMADMVIGDEEDEDVSSPLIPPQESSHFVERPKSASPEQKRRCSSTGDLEIDVENPSDSLPTSKSPKLDLGSRRPSSGGDLPHLRSAISSPLNSLLYKKKMINNALRKDDPTAPDSYLLQELSHLKDEYRIKEEMRGEERAEEAPPPTMVPPMRNVSPSDTHSSGSNPHSSPSDNTFEQSPVVANGNCFNCQLLKGKLGLSENRNRFLEGKVTSLESKISRLESKIATMDSNTRRYESEGRNLREQNESLQRKLMECQEKALGFLQKGGLGDPQKTQQFLSDILQTSSC